MLFFPVFAKLQPGPAIPTRSESARTVYPTCPAWRAFLPHASARNAGFSGLTPSIATHPKDLLVTPFFATHPKSLDLKSFACHTSEKEGGSPLSGHVHRAPLCFSCFQKSLKYWRFDPVGGLGFHSSGFTSHQSPTTSHGQSPRRAPRTQDRRTNCALFRNNSFACHTCIFSGGRGGGARFPNSVFRYRPCRRVSTRLERLLPFTSHESPVTFLFGRKRCRAGRASGSQGDWRQSLRVPGSVRAAARARSPSSASGC